jgi:hypothetical protein
VLTNTPSSELGFEAVEDGLEAELEALVGGRGCGVLPCLDAGAQPRELHRDFAHPRDGLPKLLLLADALTAQPRSPRGLGHLTEGRTEHEREDRRGRVAHVHAGEPGRFVDGEEVVVMARLPGTVEEMLSLAVVTGVALLIGFRPNPSPVEWVATVGVLGLITLALTWLCVAFGLVTKTVEAASNLPTPLVFLPFLGSGFVPTDSMPTGLRWFADYQPFTPLIETVRGLLTGTPIGNHAVIALAWSAAITLASYLWAKNLYNRDRTQ